MTHFMSNLVLLILKEGFHQSQLGELKWLQSGCAAT